MLTAALGVLEEVELVYPHPVEEEVDEVVLVEVGSLPQAVVSAVATAARPENKIVETRILIGVICFVEVDFAKLVRGKELGMGCAKCTASVVEFGL